MTTLQAAPEAGSPASRAETVTPHPQPRAPTSRKFAFNAAVSAGASLFRTLLQLALLPIMARLLDPTAYGLYALALPTVTFFMLLADGGIGASLSREDEANTDVWSTAFWALLVTCVVLGGFVILSGFVLARIAGQPTLSGLMALLSLALPLMAITIPADARLIRRGNLIYHWISDLAAVTIGAVVAIVFAIHGAGAWSLAAQYLTTFAVRAVVLNYAGWSRPSLTFKLALMRNHLATGGATLTSRLAELLGKGAENAVFGHNFGPPLLGAYSLASQVSRFSCDAVTNPLLTAFYAHALHADDESVRMLHGRLSRLTMTLLLPCTAIATVLAPSIFPDLLGPQWTASASLLQMLLVPYSFLSVGWLSGQVLLKHGILERGAVVQALAAVARVAFVALGAWMAPLTVAGLIGFSYAVQAIAMFLVVPHSLRIGASTLLRQLAPAILGACAAAATASGALHLVSHTIGGAACAAIPALIAYAVVLVVVGGSSTRMDLANAIRLVRRR